MVGAVGIRDCWSGEHLTWLERWAFEMVGVVGIRDGWSGVHSIWLERWPFEMVGAVAIGLIKSVTGAHIQKVFRLICLSGHIFASDLIIKLHY